MTTPPADSIEGCWYCQDRANRLIDGLAGNPQRATLLMECPQCGQYYGYFAYQPQWRPPLTPEEAVELFPDAFRDGRPKATG